MCETHYRKLSQFGKREIVEYVRDAAASDAQYYEHVAEDALWPKDRYYYRGAQRALLDLAVEMDRVLRELGD